MFAGRRALQQLSGHRPEHATSITAWLFPPCFVALRLCLVVVGKSKSIVTNGGANVQIGLRSKTVRNSNLLNLCSQKEQEQAQAFRMTWSVPLKVKGPRLGEQAAEGYLKD